jgi:hypothetical protein
MGVMLVPCLLSRYEPEEGQSNALLGDAAFRGGESALNPRAAGERAIRGRTINRSRRKHIPPWHES